jgi:hypothetical protein
MSLTGMLMGGLRVLGSFFVIPLLVMLGCSLVSLGGTLVVLRSFLV